jgi:FtsZ-binding cell division protein ZapB
LRGKIDEVRVLQRKVEELQRVNGGLVVLNRRLGRRNGQVVQENDMLRALHKGRRR